MPKKDNIRQMFDTIASDYDFLNHLMSLGVDRGWRRKALREIVGAADAPQAAAEERLSASATACCS